jgi:hypothetical protein
LAAEAAGQTYQAGKQRVETSPKTEERVKWTEPEVSAVSPDGDCKTHILI